jgi:hypothetical protein
MVKNAKGDVVVYVCRVVMEETHGRRPFLFVKKDERSKGRMR